jgi:hypothetical protein
MDARTRTPRSWSTRCRPPVRRQGPLRIAGGGTKAFYGGPAAWRSAGS